MAWLLELATEYAKGALASQCRRTVAPKRQCTGSSRRLLSGLPQRSVWRRYGACKKRGVPEKECQHLHEADACLPAVLVEGHTDHQGSDQSNPVLSEACTGSLMVAIADRKVPAGRLAMAGLFVQAADRLHATEEGR